MASMVDTLREAVLVQREISYSDARAWREEGPPHLRMPLSACGRIATTKMQTQDL